MRPEHVLNVTLEGQLRSSPIKTPGHNHQLPWLGVPGVQGARIRLASPAKPA